LVWIWVRRKIGLGMETADALWEGHTLLKTGCAQTHTQTVHLVDIIKLPYLIAHDEFYH